MMLKEPAAGASVKLERRFSSPVGVQAPGNGNLLAACSMLCLLLTRSCRLLPAVCCKYVSVYSVCLTMTTRLQACMTLFIAKLVNLKTGKVKHTYCK
jgi:hypothetical protein